MHKRYWLLALFVVGFALNDPEPLNRVLHSCAVQKICGRDPHEPLEVDITSPPAARAKQIKAMKQKWQ